MLIEQFDLERLQSEWEHRVKYNLSESGVHPLYVRDLLEESGMDGLLNLRLGYAQTNGPEPLRERICHLYPGAGIDNVLVTNGTAEANFISTWNLLEAGDEMICMLPNYMQIYGIARSFGTTVNPLNLREDCGWAPDLDQLARTISPRTKLIVICNPNNPTGAVLNEEAMDEVVRLAERVDAWVLADEVYRGAELDRQRTPTFWGRYEKVLAVAGLSKSFRTARPANRMDRGPKRRSRKQAWAYHDYTTIAAGTINYHLAYLALEPKRRERILNHSQDVLNENLAILQAWIAEHGDLLHFDSTARWCDGLCAVQPISQFNRAGCEAASRQERTDDSRRLLQHGPLPPPWVRGGEG